MPAKLSVPPELRIAVVGLGPWGRNLVRAFGATPGARLVAVCDGDPERLSGVEAHRAAPDRFESFDALIASRHVDAVVIATGADAHYELARRALGAGKHVFVEKPMALTAAHALDLNNVAQRSGLKLMVGHVLEHHPGVEALDRLLSSGRLGEIQRIVSFRFGPAPSRSEGSWWSLAPHDIGLARRFFRAEPRQVLLRPHPRAPEGYVATLQFAEGTAELEVGSASPRKVRKTLLLGTRGAAELDDCRNDAPLRLLDVQSALSSRDGADLPGEPVPIAAEEPLAREARAFVRGVAEDLPFHGDGTSGYRVTAALEAGEVSLRSGHAAPVESSVPSRRPRTASAP